MRCLLLHRDPLLLGIQLQPNGNSITARKAWEKTNSAAKSSITLALTELVQIQAKAYTDDDDKSAHVLWNFLESIFKKSDE